MTSQIKTKKKSLLELASSDQFIPRICNFCDRWCDRCPKTQKCLSYAYGREIKGLDFDLNDNDTSNGIFWEKIDQSFNENMKVQSVHNLTEIEDEYLQLHANNYGNSVNKWLHENNYDLQKNANQIVLRYNNSEIVTLETAKSIVEWYSHFIGSKIERSLKGLEERKDNNIKDVHNPYRDNIGSAKIAIISCNRSIAALVLLKSVLDSKEKEILSFITHLSQIKNQILKIFPNAMEFIRPGMDE